MIKKSHLHMNEVFNEVNIVFRWMDFRGEFGEEFAGRKILPPMGPQFFPPNISQLLPFLSSKILSVFSSNLSDSIK